MVVARAHTKGEAVKLSVENHRSVGQLFKMIGADPQNEVLILTIGALNGPGFHCELCLTCDLTIRSDDAVIFDPHFAAIASVPADGIHGCFQELLGVHRSSAWLSGCHQGWPTPGAAPRASRTLDLIPGILSATQEKTKAQQWCPQVAP